MNSNSEFPTPADSGDAKPAFRKPSASAANRRYRRRSPISGSSPSDGSPAHEHGSSPKVSREDDVKVSVYRPRRDDAGGSERDSDRSYRVRSSNSYRQSDRQSCGNLDDNYRHDNYIKCDKHVDEEERDYHKLSSRSGRESRGTSHSDHIRSTDHSRKLDKYSGVKYEGSRYRSKDKDRESSFPEHQKYKDKDSSYERIVQDGKREYRRNSGDYRSGRTLYYEESKGKRSDSFSRSDGGKHQMEEGYKSDVKDTDDENLFREQRKKYDDKGTNRRKTKLREPSELSTDSDLIRSQTQESSAKRTKLFSLEKDSHRGKDGNVLKFTTTADGRESSSSKEVQEGKVTMGKAQANDVEADNDINAAKIAAIKAAELVNRNLVSVASGGCMTADQKKKLLWGNKKSTTAEEVGHHWDTTLFSDRERQEKFNKLMGVKGEIKVEHKPVKEDGSDLLQSEKQKELQLDLEKQYAAGLRRRDGRTVGLGL